MSIVISPQGLNECYENSNSPPKKGGGCYSSNQDPVGNGTCRT